LDGFALACRELGLTLSADDVILAPHAISGGMLAARRIVARRLEGAPFPDAVFATVDIVALGMLEVFRAAGVRVPEDIALISHDGLNEGTVVVPALTTIAPPRQEMGRACIDLLLRATAGEQLPALCMLEAMLIVRESTIGAGPVARYGLMTPISHPEAWTQWRTLLSTAAAGGVGLAAEGAMLPDFRKEVDAPSGEM
jgi:LacI family transcriptional regulator